MSEIKNKKMFKVFLMFIIGVMLFSLFPIKAFATTNSDDKLYIDGHEILSIYYEGSAITRGYFDPVPFSFKNEWNGATNYYDGDWMALEAKATSTAGSIPVHIDLLVYSTNTHYDCTIWSNGNNNKFDWISLGDWGGSEADCYYYVDSQNRNVTVTMDVKSYSWI